MTQKRDNSIDRVHKHREKKRVVDITPRKRTTSSRLSLWSWGQKYCKAKFTKAPSEHHKKFVDKLEVTIRNGGNFAFAFPRGSAKTTWLRIGCVWCMCEAVQPYIMFIAGSGAEARSNLAKIKTEFETNDMLLEDYPQMIAPIRAIRGVPQRARMMQDAAGNCFAFEWKAERIRMPNVSGVKSAGYIIDTCGIDGHIRGKNETLPDGTSIRPCVVLLDDPQKREDAKSPPTVKKIMEIISGDVLGLAGPGETIAAMVAGTIIERGDVMDQLTDRRENPSWHGVRVSMLENRADKEKKLWLGEYASLRRESQRNKEEIPLAANRFYRANRKEMDAGAKIYWKARYLKSKGEISAIQHAYNFLIDKGEKVFAAEYQNEPISESTVVFSLTPERVYSKQNGKPVMIMPSLPVTITAGIDLNRYGLTWNLIATTLDMASSVLAYGVHVPAGQEKIYEGAGNKRSEAEELAFYNALTDLCKRFSELKFVDFQNHPARIRRIGIDAGYLYSVVRRFTATNMQFPFELIPTRGRAAAQFRPSGANVQRIGKDWIIINDQFGALTVYNSDLWTESTQTGFTLPFGAPGEIELWGNRPADHIEYATQLCNQTLAEKLKGEKGIYYKWTTEGRNDYLDALTIARVMASLGGADVLHQTLQKPEPVQNQKKDDLKDKPTVPAPQVSYDPLNF